MANTHTHRHGHTLIQTQFSFPFRIPLKTSDANYLSLMFFACITQRRHSPAICPTVALHLSATSLPLSLSFSLAPSALCKPLNQAHFQLSCQRHGIKRAEPSQFQFQFQGPRPETVDWRPPATWPMTSWGRQRLRRRQSDA